MKIIQTFATDKYSDELNYARNTQMLFYHYCSLQCLRKVYGDDQDITLLTDTKGKELMNKYGFNYTHGGYNKNSSLSYKETFST